MKLNKVRNFLYKLHDILDHAVSKVIPEIFTIIEWLILLGFIRFAAATTGSNLLKALHVILFTLLFTYTYWKSSPIEFGEFAARYSDNRAKLIVILCIFFGVVTAIVLSISLVISEAFYEIHLKLLELGAL